MQVMVKGALSTFDGMQVYTTEEKAALALFRKQEAESKEAALIANMQKLVDKAVAQLDDDPPGRAEAEGASS
jgi:hypothetical protein